jgi:hypothetical protein
MVIGLFPQIAEYAGWQNQNLAEQQTHPVQVNCWDLSQLLQHEIFAGGLSGCYSHMDSHM